MISREPSRFQQNHSALHRLSLCVTTGALAGHEQQLGAGIDLDWRIQITAVGADLSDGRPQDLGDRVDDEHLVGAGGRWSP